MFDVPIVVAPASMLFSTSSFIAPDRSSTTWPEQILWTDSLSIGCIVLIIAERRRRKKKNSRIEVRNLYNLYNEVGD